MKRLLSHPVCQVAAALLVLTLATQVTTLPLGRATQVAITALYSGGVILLIGYLGLVPFGGSVFFGVAGYAAAIGMSRWFATTNELVGIAFALLVTLVLAS